MRILMTQAGREILYMGCKICGQLIRDGYFDTSSTFEQYVAKGTKEKRFSLYKQILGRKIYGRQASL